MLEGEHGSSGKIICDSASNEGIRLTTIHVRYPRMIHSELMTHRVFSRNGRSSRAVPVKTLLLENPYTPHFMKNKPGMVASEEMDPVGLGTAVDIWEDLIEYTKNAVGKLNILGVHKQWANRPLEWFGYIDVLITSTDWANFMALRDDEGAQPEVRAVAQLISKLMDESTPRELQPGEWHLPYIENRDIIPVLEYMREQDLGYHAITLLKKISTARCARLSIRPFDGDGSIEKELARYEKLVVSRPVHASPAEHIATPDTRRYWAGSNEFSFRSEHGNFYGWRQYRKMIPNNTVEDR